MPSDIYKKIGEEFSKILLEDLGIDVMREVIEKNKGGEDWCASHEYCDANMEMWEAFENVCGRELELDNNDDCILWCEAWDYAKSNDFFIGEV